MTMRLTPVLLVPMLALSLAALSGCSAKAAGQDGANATDTAYELQVVATPSPTPSGAQASYRVTIAPKGKWVLKTTTPFKALLKTEGACKVDKSELTAADFEDPNATAKSVGTGFSCAAPGQATIDADLSFFLCTDEICQRFKAQDKLPLSVK